MKAVSYVLFFMVMLMTSATVSFVGYRYLALASDYRAANFEHLNAVNKAIDLIRQRPVPTEDDIAALVEYVKHANAQAIWCTENLNRIDRTLASMFSSDGAFDICRNAVATGERSLQFLSALSNSYQSPARSVTATFVLYGQIIDEVQMLRDLSVSFQPFVAKIQHQLEVLVKTGTVLLSLVLTGLSAAVSRQLIRAQDRIRRQSITDDLTGLKNRRGLDQVLSGRGTDRDMIVARIDLDRFKRVNDILGHEAGDYVLQHVANLMREKTRAGDTLARVGGDEFVILFGDGTTLESGQAVLERLLAGLSEPLSFGEKRCYFGASFGIAATSIAGVHRDDLLNAADTALYEVKRSGRGAISLYTTDMHDAAMRERALADGLRDAIESHQVVPYFQTQHDAQTRDLFGVEVLARWHHPQLGVLTPDVFLPLAAQLGLEAELDRAIFGQTIAFLDELEANGHFIPRIAFNVSQGRLMDPGFLTDVMEKIPKNRDRIAFEIVESVSYEDVGDIVSATVSAIKDLGFQIDVDDFGSGHASINSVMHISPNILKIDKNIVRPIAESPAARRLTASIVDLAVALDMRVIAEGVDTAEKADILQQMGCHALQGFFFSRPMPADDIGAYLQDVDPLLAAG